MHFNCYLKIYQKMELKINIGYNELFNLIKQLPTNELFQLKVDLSKVYIHEKAKTRKKTLKSLLLTGPIMTDEQYDNYESNRKWISQWRTKI